MAFRFPITGHGEAPREADLLGDLPAALQYRQPNCDIAVLKDALQEAGQLYVQLASGAPMGFLDVGGGLGVDYDGSRSATAASTNYSAELRQRRGRHHPRMLRTPGCDVPTLQRKRPCHRQPFLGAGVQRAGPKRLNHPSIPRRWMAKP